MTAEQLNIKLKQSYEEAEKGNFELAEQLTNEVLKYLATLPADTRTLGTQLEREYILIHTRALLSLADNALLRKNFQYSLSHALSALDSANKHHFPEIKANCHNTCGRVCQEIGDYKQALEHFGEALATHEDLGAKSSVARITGNIGILYAYLGDYEKALQYMKRSLAIHEDLSAKRQIATDTGNIGLVYQHLGNYNQALEYSMKALAMYEELGTKVPAARTRMNIGNVYALIGNYGKALEYFGQALATHQELGTQLDVARITANIAKIYEDDDFEWFDMAQAEEYYLNSLAIFEELGVKKDKYECHRDLAGLYKKNGDSTKALDHFETYHNLEREVQSEETKKQAQKFGYERQIAVMLKEQEVTDHLLHKFLPSPIIPRMKSGDQIVIERFESVSILFADLVGFTKLSMKIPPTAMIELLNFVFTHFDTIIKKHGGHRLRTMGDGYFAICGAPDRIENHAERFALAALDMQEPVRMPDHIREQLPKGTRFEIRIGLHCGEVVCGLVGGLEKWQYDAYGDTVNTASRMESHGVPGKIHVTEDFVKAIGESDFHFTERGEMEIKGKGLMKTYFLEKKEGYTVH